MSQLSLPDAAKPPAELAAAKPAAPNDLRHAMMTLPIEQQDRVMAAYLESRNHFREWLLKQLIEGVHMGFPPGCQPKMEMRRVDGREVVGYLTYSRGKENWFPETQWKPKPSLYAAGADMLCDLLGVRDEYESDLVAWQQMGSKPGIAVQKCRLFSRANGSLIGESLGAYSNGSDPNNAVKMASKAAKVGAVINAYGLRDLFTNEPLVPAAPHDNPSADPSARKADARGARKAITADDLKQLWGTWFFNWQSSEEGIKYPQNIEVAKQSFTAWIAHTTGREFNPRLPAEWTQNDMRKCREALESK